ncbi:MAG: protein kinase [Gammaproteobacteria bacterium]|nr:protein kinase [Gammaproteobacteria bacterium]
MSNLVGQTLGQYQLLEIIHTGANTVYKGFQPSMNRYVAVKVLDSSQAGNPAFAQQFQQDMEFIAGLEHPNLLSILDYGQHNEWLYLVTRHVESGTLQDRLSQGYPQYNVQQAQQFIQPVADALDHLHSRGAVHGNLKPVNILIDPQGQPLVTDFGYTQGIDVGPQENAYLSPEQTQGGTVDRRTDVYALGVLLYHMLTGETPAPGMAPNPRLKRPDLPVAVEQIILTAMAQYPDQRYASARDFSNALEAVVRPQPVPVPVAPPPAVQAAPRPEPEQKGTSPVIWIGVVVVIILLLAGGCALFSGLLSGSPDEPVAPVVPPAVPTTPAEQPPPEAEQPPVAVIQAPDQAEVGEGIKFDAGASQSSNRIVSYAWEFGDGEGANAVSVRHTYKSPGVYNVILTVVDAEDLSGSSNFQINIVESSKERPTEEPPIEEPPTEEPPSIDPPPEEPPAEENQ